MARARVPKSVPLWVRQHPLTGCYVALWIAIFVLASVLAR